MFIWLLPSRAAVAIAQAKVNAEAEAFEETLKESLRLSELKKSYQEEISNTRPAVAETKDIGFESSPLIVENVEQRDMLDVPN